MRWAYSRNPKTVENWSKLLQNWLKSIQKLSKEWKGFEICFVFQPVPGINSAEKLDLDLSSVHNKGFQQRKRQLKQALRTLNGIKFLDGETVLNQKVDSQFLDVCHLNSRGYQNLRNWLIDQLNRSGN